MTQPGNGSSRFNIDQQDMGGWVRVYPRGVRPAKRVSSWADASPCW
jgi:hypothetical protein